MLTLQVGELVRLRRSIFPLLAVAGFADLKYSPTSFSLTVSNSKNLSHSFLAALQMFPPFFTISFDGDRHFLSRIFLDDLIRLMMQDDHYVTLLVPQDLTFANLIFTARNGDFQSLSLLKMLPSQNEDEVAQFVYGGFVAIDAAEFRNIVSNFSNHQNPICVTARTSEVKFSVTTKNNYYSTVLEAKERKCLAGGFPGDGAIQFSISLNPATFFYRASRLTKLVWFFLSADSKTTVFCFTGQWANILACYYPPHHMRKSSRYGIKKS